MAKITSMTLYNGDINKLPKTINDLEDEILKDDNNELPLCKYKDLEYFTCLNDKYVAQRLSEKLKEKQLEKLRLNRLNYLTKNKSKDKGNRINKKKI